MEEDAQLQPEEPGLFSCWGKLGPAALWRRLRWWASPRLRRGRLCVRPGSFKYDPLSYAQNFDEGRGGGGGSVDCDDEVAVYNHRLRFSSRFAALHPPSSPPSATSTALS